MVVLHKKRWPASFLSINISFICNLLSLLSFCFLVLNPPLRLRRTKSQEEWGLGRGCSLSRFFWHIWANSVVPNLKYVIILGEIFLLTSPNQNIRGDVSPYPRRGWRQWQRSKAWRGEEWEGNVLLPADYRVWGASQAPPAGSGAEPQPQAICGRFVCNFMRCYAYFSAFNSCLEMADSYIRLLASTYDVPGSHLTFLECRSPQLEFFGCPGTHDTRSGCATGKQLMCRCRIVLPYAGPVTSQPQHRRWSPLRNAARTNS